MHNQCEYVDSIIAKLNDLADAKGIFRCATILEIYNMLNNLKDGLMKDEEEHTKEKLVLEEKIRDLKNS